MPELPDARRDRFMSQYELSFHDASQLVSSRDLADYFEATAKAANNPRAASNWIRTELIRELEAAGKTASESPASPDELGALIRALDEEKINGKQAKEVLVEMFKTGKGAEETIAALGFVQISDTGEIEKIVDEVIANNPKQLEQYRAGKEALFGFFVGQVMKASQGKANPKVVNELLKEKLKG
jgi:aspartyl-tRNA(Asn)/glutamyl-tRNA(Gln) amidotransferase subunit B